MLVCPGFVQGPETPSLPEFDAGPNPKTVQVCDRPFNFPPAGCRLHLKKERNQDIPPNLVTGLQVVRRGSKTKLDKSFLASR